MKKIKEETKDLFAPFFKLDDYLHNCKIKEKKVEEKYKELVDQCMSSFYGTGKLSINRPMQHNFGILCFIYGIDGDRLFEVFISTFNEKITKKRRNDLIKWCCLELNQVGVLSEFEEVERVASILYKEQHFQNTLMIVKKINQELISKGRESSLPEFETFLEGKILREKINSGSVKTAITRL